MKKSRLNCKCEGEHDSRKIDSDSSLELGLGWKLKCTIYCVIQGIGIIRHHETVMRARQLKVENNVGKNNFSVKPLRKCFAS